MPRALYYDSAHRKGMTYPTFEAGSATEWLAENADASHALCARANWRPRNKDAQNFSVKVLVNAPYGAAEIEQAREEARAFLARRLAEAAALTREHALMFQAFPQLSVTIMHRLWWDDVHSINDAVYLVTSRSRLGPRGAHLGAVALRRLRQAVEQYLHQCPPLRYATTLILEPVRVPCGCHICKGQQCDDRWSPQDGLPVFLATGVWPRPRGKSLGQIDAETKAWERKIRAHTQAFVRGPHA